MGHRRREASAMKYMLGEVKIARHGTSERSSVAAPSDTGPTASVTALSP